MFALSTEFYQQYENATHSHCHVKTILLRKIRQNTRLLWPLISYIRTESSIPSMYGKNTGQRKPYFDLFYVVFVKNFQGKSDDGYG